MWCSCGYLSSLFPYRILCKLCDNYLKVLSMAECVLKPCKDKGGELITLTRKAVDKIVQCSEIRKDGVKEKFLQNDSLQVHSNC